MAVRTPPYHDLALLLTTFHPSHALLMLVTRVLLWSRCWSRLGRGITPRSLLLARAGRGRTTGS
eukprot:2613715-Rhodomonas_salina.1